MSNTLDQKGRDPLAMDYELAIEEDNFELVKIGVDPEELPEESVVSFFNQQHVVSIIPSKQVFEYENYEDFMIRLLLKLEKLSKQYDWLDDTLRDELGINIVVKDRDV